MPTTTEDFWKYIQKYFPLLLCLLVFPAAFWIADHLDRGLELTDEGFYWVHIATPDTPLVKTTDFGHLWQPVYMFFGESVYALRIIGFLLLTGSGAAIGFCLRFLALSRRILPPEVAWCLPVTLLGCALTYYSVWLPTPSYNMTALCATNIAVCCLLLYSENELRLRALRFRRLAALSGLAVAGVCCFIGKGSTGAGLALVAVGWMVLTPRTQPRTLLAIGGDICYAAALACLLLAGYVAFLSEGILLTWQKLLAGIRMLDDNHDLLLTLGRYGDWVFPRAYAPVLLCYLPLLAALATFRRGNARLAGIGILLTALLMVVLGLALPTSKVQGLCAVPLLVSSLIAVRWFGDTSIRPEVCPRFWVLLGSAILFLLPVYHSGTDIEVEQKVTEALVLMGAGIFALLFATSRQKRSALIMAAAFLLCCMAGSSLSRSLLDTYRQAAPMYALREAVELTPGTRPLLVSTARAAWIRWLRETASAQGFGRGTPLLYTSSRVVAAAPLLGTFPPAVVWPPEQQYTADDTRYIRMYTLAGEDMLRRAWILKPAKDGPRHMPARVLRKLGLPFPQGYECVGISPAVGVCPPEVYELWKPRASHPASNDGH